MLRRSHVPMVSIKTKPMKPIKAISQSLDFSVLSLGVVSTNKRPLNEVPNKLSP